MSQWTHVNASIRFDEINREDLPTEKELGKICRWEDEDFSHWGNSTLPCGSEGSLEYAIIANPDIHCIAAMAVVFFGDLRDYNNANEILKYFGKITEGRMIRSGILEVDIENNNTLIYRYDSENKKWVKCI